MVTVPRIRGGARLDFAAAMRGTRFLGSRTSPLTRYSRTIIAMMSIYCSDQLANESRRIGIDDAEREGAKGAIDVAASPAR